MEKWPATTLIFCIKIYGKVSLPFKKKVIAQVDIIDEGR